MKHVFSSVLLALSAAALPLACHATALDAPLACNESGHQFIADLAQQQLIDPTPMRVESNSINAFRPAKGADLSAFGFHVFAVVGFEKDDPMFRTGDGEPLANSAYGAVVFGGDVKRAGRRHPGRQHGDRASRRAAYHRDFLQAELRPAGATRRGLGSPQLVSLPSARPAKAVFDPGGGARLA